MTAGRRGNSEGSAPRQRADGRWVIQLRYTDDLGVGKRIDVYGKTAKDVRSKSQAVRDRLAADLPAKDSKMTVGAFAVEWIESTLAASDRKANTKTLYAGIVRKHIEGSKLGALTFDAIAPRHIDAWIVGLRAQPLADSTVRTVYTVLRAMLDTAVRDGVVSRNAAAAVKRPKVTSEEAVYLNVSEVRRLLAAAAPSRYAPVFELLVNTGLRRGEALALRWSDIDFDRSVLRVRGTLARVDGELIITSPKTANSVRSVHMSAATDRILRSARLAQKQERIRAGIAVDRYRLRVRHGVRDALRSPERAARTEGRRR